MLKETDLFLCDRELNKLSYAENIFTDLTYLGKTKNFKNRKLLFQKGDEGDFLYLLISGQVEIKNYSSSGKEVLLNKLHEGEIFGELAVLDGQKRTASAYATKNTRLCLIQKNILLKYLNGDIKRYYFFLQLICERLRYISNNSEDHALINTEKKIARKLLQLNKKTNQENKISISQEVFAKMIGTSRETVNIELNKFEKIGVVQLQRKKILISNSQYLKNLAEC